MACSLDAILRIRIIIKRVKVKHRDNKAGCFYKSDPVAFLVSQLFVWIGIFQQANLFKVTCSKYQKWPLNAILPGLLREGGGGGGGVGGVAF